MKLILSGGGDAGQTKKLDEFFVSLIYGERKILYIPIAMKLEYNTKECLDWLKKCLNPLKVKNIKTLDNLNGKTFESIRGFDAIYIGGGNTFSLLKDLKDSKFISILEKYSKKGIIYGGSAGAIILGKTINMAGSGKDADGNIVGLTNFNGLNLIHDFDIQCHYEKDQDKDLFCHIKKNKNKIIAIPEGTGLYVEGKKMFVKGEGSVFVFNKGAKKEFKVNEEVIF